MNKMWLLIFILLCAVVLDLIKIDMINSKNYPTKHASCGAVVKVKELEEKKVLDLDEQGARM